ncbi:MAG: MazG nucleotide pyrophosphohydrolase domain-containing protein [Hominisplanchenecus sp.]
MQCFKMDESHSFDDFREIVDRLRQECPWDRAQTLSSLKPCLLDETAETVAGINIYEKTGRAENLCEELGDLLLLVLLESRIAKEQGLFDLDDVIEGISRKMIRRHPHVFGTGYVDENGELVRRWDEIKKLEKAEKTAEERKLEEAEVRSAIEEVYSYYSQSEE